jgi:hypothetical protein
MPGDPFHTKSSELVIIRPLLFFDVNHMVIDCVECKMFVGKHKLQPLPLKPVNSKTPFQQWGLDFIG